MLSFSHHRSKPGIVLCLLLTLSFSPGSSLLAQNGSSQPGQRSTESPLGRIKLGNLLFSFSPEKGFSLSDQGVPLIDGSTLRVRNTAWKRVYFDLAESSPTVKVADADGSKVITVTNLTPDGQPQANQPFFRYTLMITVTPAQPTESLREAPISEVTFNLVYEAAADVTDRTGTKVEFGMGLVNANPIKGQDFVADLSHRKIKGILPVVYPALFTPNARPYCLEFNRMTIDSRLGVWSIRGEGDHPTLTLKDARGEHWAIESGKSVFWLGVPESPLPLGRKVTLGADLKFSTTAPSYVKAQPHGATRLRTASLGGSTRENVPIRQIDVSNARIPVENPIRFIPQPQQFEPRKDDFIFEGGARIFISPHPTEDDTFTAELLTRELEQIYKIKVIVEPWSDTTSAGTRREPQNCILLGETNVHPGCDLVCRGERLEVSPQSPGPEGYVISVTPRYVLVAGSDTAGTFYGVQTLLQMITPREDGAVAVKGGMVRDFPDFEFRGVHLLADDYAATWIGELITKVFARHKINNIVLECEYARWDSHPEIQHPWGMTKADMRKVKELANRYHIQVVPLIQSLGHCEWMFANGKNLDLVEDPDCAYAYCPSNPTGYAFLFDIYQEAIDLFKPKYLHIGHDEVTRKGRFGQCSRCAGRPPARLFADNVRLIQDFLSARHVKTMMWGDMLLAPSEARDATDGGAPYDIHEARSLISRDIIICDWHYNPYRDYPSLRLFTQAGFNVVGATWHDRRNIFYLSKSARQAGAFGMLQTTWTGYHGNRTALQRQTDQIAAYLVAADYYWSAENPPVDRMPYRPTLALLEDLNHKPAVRDAQAGFLVDLSPMATIDMMDTDKDGAWLRYGRRFDLRRLPVGPTRFGSLLFHIPARRGEISGLALMLRGTYLDPNQFPRSVEIPINRQAHELAFLHTCGWAAAEGQKVGAYEIVYDDGSTRSIDLIYGENIYAWDDGNNNISDGAVWHGATIAGSPVSIGAFTWENPNPTKVVAKIIARAEDTEAAPALISITGLTDLRNGHTPATLTAIAPTNDKSSPVISTAPR